GSWAYANEDCRDVWKVPAAPAAMRQPVSSSIPTLLISGSFDTLTSLAGAKAAAANLSKATIIMCRQRPDWQGTRRLPLGRRQTRGRQHHRIRHYGLLGNT